MILRVAGTAFLGDGAILQAVSVAAAGAERGLVALARLVALAVAVVALDQALVGAVARHVAFLAAGIAFSREVARVRAVLAAVAGERYAS